MPRLYCSLVVLVTTLFMILWQFVARMWTICSFRNPEDERRTVTLTGGAYTQDELRRYEISESRKRRMEPVAPDEGYDARRRREMPPLTQEVCFCHLCHMPRA